MIKTEHLPSISELNKEQKLHIAYAMQKELDEIRRRIKLIKSGELELDWSEHFIQEATRARHIIGIMFK